MRVTTEDASRDIPARGPWVWVPQDSGKLDLSPAMRYGTMVSFSRTDCPVTRVHEMVTLAQEWMEEFNPSTDFLMLIGDPVLISICVAEISRRFDIFHVLKWNRQTHEYIPLKIEKPRRDGLGGASITEHVC